MKVEEYIDKEITLEGYGQIDVLRLDRSFFVNMEAMHGKIEDVRAITAGTGGILPPFGHSKIKGCIILFKSGTILCAESDNEYVDLFSG